MLRDGRDVVLRGTRIPQHLLKMESLGYYRVRRRFEEQMPDCVNRFREHGYRIPPMKSPEQPSR